MIETFDELVERLTRQGNKIIAPNNLKISCVRADGTLLEHEHAEHITYMFPVDVVYCGENAILEYQNEYGLSHPFESEQEAKECLQQEHALIYRDYNIVLTIYEYAYFMWDFRSGECLNKPSYKDYRLSLNSDGTIKGRKI